MYGAICLTPECAEFVRDKGDLCDQCLEKTREIDAKGDDGVKHSSRFSKTRRVMQLAKVMTFDGPNERQQDALRHIASMEDTIEAIRNSDRKRLRFKTQQEAAVFLHASRGQVFRAIRNHSTVAGYTLRDLSNKRKRLL